MLRLTLFLFLISQYCHDSIMFHSLDSGNGDVLSLASGTSCNVVLFLLSIAVVVLFASAQIDFHLVNDRGTSVIAIVNIIFTKQAFDSLVLR